VDFQAPPATGGLPARTFDRKAAEKRLSFALFGSAGLIPAKRPPITPKVSLTKGTCAKCRQPIYAMNHVVTTKDGALFHGRCWQNC
jgi:hypothetical protein